MDLLVRLGVDGSRRLVENENLAVAKERPTEAHELALAGTQVAASLVDVSVELAVLSARAGQYGDPSTTDMKGNAPSTRCAP